MTGPHEVQIRRHILTDNDRAARRVRARLAEAGTLALNLISSPGSGKTTLLEATVRALGRGPAIGSLVGDVATERDADRLRAAGIPARQILTAGACHLDARLVETALDAAAFGRLDYLFVENVGNLICPTSYDLGEDLKVALLSVTEGDDKVLKYPGIFAHAQAALITKSDLLPHVPFDVVRVREEIRLLNSAAAVVVLSARTGEGMASWCGLLQRWRAAKRLKIEARAD